MPNPADMHFLEYAPAPESRAIVHLKPSYGLFIDGQWTDGHGTPFPTISPASEERLAEIATAFAEEDVSIQTLRQEGRGADAQLVVVSHDATDAQLARTVERLRELSCVREVSSVMRVEGMAD